MSPKSKTILITGANTGLGLEIVKALCRSQHSYTVLVGGRSLSKVNEAITSVEKEYASSPSTLRPLQVDLSSDASIESAVATIAKDFGHLDTLVNNAGANFDVSIQTGELSVREGFNKAWDTNVAGTQVLTTHAIPLLLKSTDPRLIFMTSGTSSLVETDKFDNPMFQRLNGSPAKGWPKESITNPVTCYRSVKTGLNMLMREWNRILKEDGIKVWCVSPGFLATGLAGVGVERLKAMGALDPSIGGEFVVNVVEGHRDNDVGKIVRKDMNQPLQRTEVTIAFKE